MNYNKNNVILIDNLNKAYVKAIWNVFKHNIKNNNNNKRTKYVKK